MLFFKDITLNINITTNKTPPESLSEPEPEEDKEPKKLPDPRRNRLEDLRKKLPELW